MYRELLLGCGAKRVKDLRLPTAAEIRAVESGAPMETFAEQRMGTAFLGLTTLDNNENHQPNILFDLSTIDGTTGNRIIWDAFDKDGTPLYPARRPEGEGVVGLTNDDWYDEIHAYEVLEHIGAQGDYRLFFAQFSEFWRILKPGGFFFATCPAWHSAWAWGDPSHTRVITAGTLAFLSQDQYTRQVGVTPMSDFRHIYTADFEPVVVNESGESLIFALRAKK